MTDKALVKYATSFRKGILGRMSSTSMCFAVSQPLSTLLNMGPVKNVPTEGHVRIADDDVDHDFKDVLHWWLTLEDGRILDPTADQFSTSGRRMPPVYLGPLPAWYKENP